MRDLSCHDFWKVVLAIKNNILVTVTKVEVDIPMGDSIFRLK
jgi:hypothetical protein